eukprot:4072631-Amphidinium_carterae.1
MRPSQDCNSREFLDGGGPQASQCTEHRSLDLCNLALSSLLELMNPSNRIAIREAAEGNGSDEVSHRVET